MKSLAYQHINLNGCVFFSQHEADKKKMDSFHTDCSFSFTIFYFLGFICMSSVTIRFSFLSSFCWCVFFFSILVRDKYIFSLPLTLITPFPFTHIVDKHNYDKARPYFHLLFIPFPIPSPLGYWQKHCTLSDRNSYLYIALYKHKHIERVSFSQYFTILPTYVQQYFFPIPPASM